MWNLWSEVFIRNVVLISQVKRLYGEVSLLSTVQECSFNEGSTEFEDI